MMTSFFGEDLFGAALCKKAVLPKGPMLRTQ